MMLINRGLQKKLATPFRVFPFLFCFLCLLISHCTPVQRTRESPHATETEEQSPTGEQSPEKPSRTPEEQLEFFNLFLDRA